MSRSSRNGIRAKQEFAKSLDRIHQAEIDEFLRTQVFPVCRDCDAELSRQETDVCLECKYFYGHDDFEDDYWGAGDEDWYDAEPALVPGSYYRDKDGHTYLCCLIARQAFLVSVLTGREAKVSFGDLEKVY
jgi:hypothetical protein